MRKILVAGLSLGCVLAPCAAAAQVDDAARFEQGQQLYEAHCARCHGASGEGRPPTFPALSGNERLEDAARIVGVLREGSGGMPPFPTLTAAETSSLATYVRNAWTNDFGGVTIEEADAASAAFADAGPAASVWDGVFSEAQAARGRLAYSGACGFCHGRRLNGAPDDPDMRSTPPLARARFLREWEGTIPRHPVRVHAADDARGQSDIPHRRGVRRRHRLHALGQPDTGRRRRPLTRLAKSRADRDTAAAVGIRRDAPTAFTIRPGGGEPDSPVGRGERSRSTHRGSPPHAATL